MADRTEGGKQSNTGNGPKGSQPQERRDAMPRRRRILPVIAEEIRLLVPASVARTFGVIPVDREAKIAVFVAKQPLNDDTVQKLQFFCGPLEFRIAGPDEFEAHRYLFDELLEAHYPKSPDRLSGRCCPAQQRSGRV
jgi:hypothetical protein